MSPPPATCTPSRKWFDVVKHPGMPIIAATFLVLGLLVVFSQSAAAATPVPAPVTNGSFTTSLVQLRILNSAL